MCKNTKGKGHIYRKKVKLGQNYQKCIYRIYAEYSKAYRLLDLKSNIIVKSKDVEFIENKFHNNFKSVQTAIQE